MIYRLAKWDRLPSVCAFIEGGIVSWMVAGISPGTYLKENIAKHSGLLPQEPSGN